MSVVLAVVRLEDDAGLPEDVSINTFHFNTAGTPPTVAQIDSIEAALVSFYNDDGVTSLRSIGSYLSADITRAANGCSITTYDLNQPSPRIPLAVHQFTLDAAANSDRMPQEVALCLSYRIDPYVAGIPTARQRGRVYIGPLNSNGVAFSSGRPTQNLIDTLAEAGDRLATDAGTEWVVFSKAQNPDTGFIVEAGWVDNAFDTQRRRGQAATARTNWS